jgi:hypothetical protein
MDKAELQAHYMDLLLGWIEDTRYPSTSMLDRTEQAICDHETALEYVHTLLETVAQDRYPSPPMLNRITRLLDCL